MRHLQKIEAFAIVPAEAQRSESGVKKDWLVKSEPENVQEKKAQRSGYHKPGSRPKEYLKRSPDSSQQWSVHSQSHGKPDVDISSFKNRKYDSFQSEEGIPGCKEVCESAVTAGRDSANCKQGSGCLNALWVLNPLFAWPRQKPDRSTRSNAAAETPRTAANPRHFESFSPFLFGLGFSWGSFRLTQR